MQWRRDASRRPRAVLLDPCAGDGEAILELRRRWAESLSSGPYSFRIQANEMEAERAAALEAALETCDQALAGDAFHLSWAGGGASVLWLNPPYDTDPDEKRLELKFLKRFTPALRPSIGVLMFLVPYRVLEVAAAYISRHYLLPRAWRLPDPHFGDFGQVLLVARRAPATLAPNPTEATLRRWGAEPQALDPLPEVVDDPLVIDPPDDDLTLRLESFDLAAVLAGRDASQHLAELRELGARELLGGRFSTAMPPRAAHIALALASGMFNGLRLAPNDPQQHPPLLVKGVFERKLLEISERRNAEGELTGTVEVERPSLRLTALRLDTYEYLELAPGTTATGSGDLARWNVADLIESYDRSLAKLLKDQFPPIHDPRRRDHSLALPRLARTLYTIQRHAILAALKLLALGETPFLVADVGTGKSTMGLFVAAALSPAYRAETLADLERLGFAVSKGHGRRRRSRLPAVRRTLILCPPHLQGSWVDQTRAVLPEARIQLLRQLSDLDAEADVYILSRETAKLGHAYRGLEGACPRCGVPISTPAKKNAAKRLTCPARRRSPDDPLARLAKELAEHLAPSCSGEALVLSSGVEPAYLARCARRPEPRPLRVTGLGSLRRRLLATVAALLEERSCNRLCAALGAIERLASATGTTEVTAERLTALARRDDSYLGGYCRDAAERLRSDERCRDPREHLLAALEPLHLEARWHDSPPCGEPLYQAIPQPRRVAFARRIARRYRRKFDLVLLDEAHEYNHTRSAQTHAAHRLVGLPGVRTLVLTGSLMGGYASSLFSLFWALSPRFRAEFQRGEKARFTQRYGYHKVLVAPRKKSDGGATYGAHTDRKLSRRRQCLGEAPGVMPPFLMKHLLPTAILVHKSDLDEELPPLIEKPVALTPSVEEPFDREVVAEYERLKAVLLGCIKADRFVAGRAGKLLGALVELPSYLDRSTVDLGPFKLAYPEAPGGMTIAEGRSFPAHYVSLKERFLLAELAERLHAGERVAVFLRHTGGALPARLTRLIQQRVTGSCLYLDARRVPAPKREAWLDRHVIERGVKVLILNPNTVRTGLNNLIAFTTAIWHEIDYSSTTYLQANGRFHRIGQTRPVTILYPYWDATAQASAFGLIARKVTAAHQVSGFDICSALEAAGAGEESASSLETALALGEALYRQLAPAA